jgi:hypothetical protein
MGVQTTTKKRLAKQIVSRVEKFLQKNRQKNPNRFFVFNRGERSSKTPLHFTKKNAQKYDPGWSFFGL